MQNTQKRIEILAPAGGYESLVAAVRSGADAVYLGEKSFSARTSAKNFDNDELKNEINDLLYHVMVLCANQGLEWSEVEKVLDERNEKIGNLKKFHQVDKNT